MSTVSTASSKRGNPYSRAEEKKIIQWIIEQNRFSEVSGIKMWKILGGCNVLPGRSDQSMKERFRKHILPNIQHYQDKDISKDDIDRFKLNRNSSTKKKK